ncbi:hypothetical protein BH09PSE4_BH09PSE4_22250 [soil metagenome]
MLHVLIYLTILIGCCLYSLFRGGAPERIGVGILFGAIVLSAFAPKSGPIRFQTFESGLFVVDSMMAAALILLSLRAQRYWPMWVAAIQIDVIATHLMMLSPSIMPWSYSMAMAFWSYPASILIAIGTWRHRQRLARYGEDPAWSRPRQPVEWLPG